MNKIYFGFLIFIIECLHNYATVMIVFFVLIMKNVRTVGGGGA